MHLTTLLTKLKKYPIRKTDSNGPDNMPKIYASNIKIQRHFGKKETKKWGFSGRTTIDPGTLDHSG